MPKFFPAQLYFKIERDGLIPHNVSDASIILTPKGLREMAKFYKEKYNIDIMVFSTSIPAASEHLSKLLKEVRQENSPRESYRCGFIFINNIAGRHGHAMPIIFEKNGINESLFFLDTGQYLGRIPTDNTGSANIKALEQVTKFRKVLLELNTHMTLWSHIGKRQIDLSSCGTDALVILKDGLRLKVPLADIATQKFLKIEDNVNFFYMPEELMKTAQISSFPEHSNANLNKIIHRHNIKYKNKPTGEISTITLNDFRKKYDVDVTTRIPIYKESNHTLFEQPIAFKEEKKKFGTYTLYKGQKIATILQHRWKSQQYDNIISLLAELASTKENFDQKMSYSKEASKTEDNFLNVIRGEVSLSAVEKIIIILDYSSLVLSNRQQFPIKTLQHAESVIELLTALCKDKEQPNVLANLEKFLKESKYNIDNEVILLAEKIVDCVENQMNFEGLRS